MNLGQELFVSAGFCKLIQSFDAVCEHLDPSWVEEALLSTGTASLRRRRLPAQLVIWLVIGIALFRNRSIEYVASHLDLTLPGHGGKPASKSSLADARARLGDEPMAWLYSRTAREWARRSADEHRWRGLALYGADGTKMYTPDTPENREYFRGSHSGRGESGFPMVRLVVLMALTTHVTAAAAFGPYENGECTLAEELWRHVADHSLTILDRAFLAAGILLPLQSGGKNRHWLTRAKKNTKMVVIEHHAPGDDIVEMEVSSAARKKNPSLPTRWKARAIRYQHKGFRPQLLLTSMLDVVEFPAKEVAAIYHLRWELELAYDEVKTEMAAGEATLRSQHPRGISQEMFGILLAHNLVRLEMVRIAKEAGVSPLRISFVMAMRLICDEWMWSSLAAPGAIPRHLLELAENIKSFILPPRRKRSVPRKVKLKMSPYNRLRPGDRAKARTTAKGR